MTNTDKLYDAAVIGGGVVGAMIARELSKYNADICILEAKGDVAMGASRANSAIVHAGFDAQCGSLKASLNVKGSKMMEKTAVELGVKYRKNGSMVIGFNDEDRKELQKLCERGRENGVETLEIIDGDTARRMEPNLSKEVICALLAPTGAIVCPYELTIAAIGNAMDNGAELFLNFEVGKIEKAGDIFEVSSDSQTVRARVVINAAGIYSDKIAKLAGDCSFEIHARRGEYLLLDKDSKSVSRTIFQTPGKMGKGILVTPTVDDNMLLGPTSVDIEDKEDNSVTDLGISDIILKVKKSVPDVNVRNVITSFCGLRAVGSSGDFIINSPFCGFINAAGIESPGLSASPAIAEYVCEMVGKVIRLEMKKKFNPIRPPMHLFSEASIDEKNEMIKRNSAYGRIVCRCEKITEGEILNALRQNPKARDLDGVKRRTRAQMGRCQGGFCTPYITELIAKELGIPEESVTKNSKASYINLKKTKESRSND